MSNRIRYYMKQEVQELLPFLHETYMRIGRFQKNRSERNEGYVLKCLENIAPILVKFRDIVQSPKRPYFDAIAMEGLSTSDRIIALDTAVGAMHIEFSVPRMYQHRESEQLRVALEQARHSPEDTATPPEHGTNEGAICVGIPASPGVAWGEVFFWGDNADYDEIPRGCILVAQAARPEIAGCIDRIDGIVTDSGGRLCHAAIVANEKGVPCVVGTRNATQVLQQGEMVCVDGTNGRVLRQR